MDVASFPTYIRLTLRQKDCVCVGMILHSSSYRRNPAKTNEHKAEVRRSFKVEFSSL